MIYSDSSFLLALLLPADFFHPHALPIAARFTESIPLTLLAELEVTNTIRRALREGKIDRAQHDQALAQIGADLTDGILSRRDVSQNDLYRRARDLSKKYTPVIAARSLDILHVAAALEMDVKTFCSFDLRQRDLAKAAGLKLLPKRMP